MHLPRSGWSLAVPVVLVLLVLTSGCVQAQATHPAFTPRGTEVASVMPSFSSVPPSHAASGSARAAHSELVHPAPGNPRPSTTEYSWYNATAALNAIHLVGGFSSPPAIEDGAMAQESGAFADNSSISVEFGGYLNGTDQLSNQTWAYLGPGIFGPSLWYNITVPADSPPAVAEPSFSFDPRIPGFVLFGGVFQNGSLSNETWILNATTLEWTNYTGTACFFECPGARSDAGMAFAADSEDNVTVLFGGCADIFCFGQYNDTWELVAFLGGFVWFEETESTAPTPRSDFAFAYAGNVAEGLVLFGGCSSALGTCSLNDTWIFTNGTWYNDTAFLGFIGSATPPGRAYAEFGWVNYWGADLLTGGFNDTVFVFNDSWIFECGTGLCFWYNDTPYFGGVAVYEGMMPGNISYGDPVVFGGYSGQTGTASNVTWILQENTSFELSVSNLNPEVNRTFTINSTLMTATAPDESFSVWVFTDPGVSNFNITDNQSLSLSTVGTWFVNATAIDAWDVGATASFVLTVGVPGVHVGASTMSTDVGVPVEFQAAPTGAWTGPLAFTWTFGDSQSSAQENVSHSYSTSGIYTAHVLEKDSLNNTASGSVQVTVHARPVSSITTAETTVEAGTSLNFTGHVLNGTPSYTYSWNFGDASSAVTTSQAAHAFASAGSYTVTLTVTDAVGVDANSSVVIQVIAPLVATVGSNVTSAHVGVPIQFTATGSGGTGGYLYLWRFGDGSTSLQATASHFYTTAGNYTARVWVNDSSGNSVEKSIAIQITKAPGSSGSNPNTSAAGASIPSWVWVVVVLVLLAGVVGAVLILRGRRKTPPAATAPPAPWVETPAGSEPTTGGGPPPGAR